MAKKGFLEKMGLVESVNTEPEIPILEPIKTVANSEIMEIAIPVQGNSDNIIDNIYESNNLSDKSQSIYKVSEFINALPKEMPNNIKQTSVLSILNISGLKVENLILDAENRTELLTTQLANIKYSNDTKISEAEADIENLTKMIEDLNKVIYDSKIETEKTQVAIETEIDCVSKLKEFLGGKSI